MKLRLKAREQPVTAPQPVSDALQIVARSIWVQPQSQVSYDIGTLPPELFRTPDVNSATFLLSDDAITIKKVYGALLDSSDPRTIEVTSPGEHSTMVYTFESAFATEVKMESGGGMFDGIYYNGTLQSSATVEICFSRVSVRETYI